MLFNVLKTTVDVGRAKVSDVVEFFQFARHKFASAIGGAYLETQDQKLLFNTLDGRVEFIGGNWSFAKWQINGRRNVIFACALCVGNVF